MFTGTRVFDFFVLDLCVFGFLCLTSVSLICVCLTFVCLTFVCMIVMCLIFCACSLCVWHFVFFLCVFDLSMLDLCVHGRYVLVLLCFFVLYLCVLDRCVLRLCVFNLGGLELCVRSIHCTDIDLFPFFPSFIAQRIQAAWQQSSGIYNHAPPPPSPFSPFPPTPHRSTLGLFVSNSPCLIVSQKPCFLRVCLSGTSMVKGTAASQHNERSFGDFMRPGGFHSR